MFEEREWNRTTFTIASTATYDIYILLNAPVLQYVYIQHNPKVHQLFIEHCALVSIPKTISNLPTLRKLSIRFCRLRYLNMYDFLHVPTLSTIDLAHNQIATVYEPPVKGTRLPTRELFLNNNSLHHANMSWFSTMENLTCLHLDCNHLEELDASVPMPTLHELSVAYNRLRTLDLSRWSFLSSLSIVYVNNNHLTSAPVGWSSLVRLEVLDLSCNHIGSFLMDDLYLTKVRRLSLATNELTTVTTSMLHLRVPLEMLQLSKNRLSVLDVSRWDMPNLWELNVANNRLTELGDTFTRFPSLGSLLNLSQNVWSCRWLASIHPAELKAKRYAKLSTNDSCVDRKHMISEQLWICCWDEAPKNAQ
uniref:Leucine rich immune protein (Coil-less) n=1 Tax=Anopheles atroparvus TaxID=41427 RepID=A0A182J9L5_ANOAO